MHVRHILQTKGAHIVSIPAVVSLAQAALCLARERIGALLVCDEKGALAGIFSERDLVRAVARDGAAALDRPVAAYLTADVVTCRPHDTVEDIMEIMTHGRFRHVPVLDDEARLCGLVSIGDVVKSRIAETAQEAEALRGYITAAA